MDGDIIGLDLVPKTYTMLENVIVGNMVGSKTTCRDSSKRYDMDNESTSK